MINQNQYKIDQFDLLDAKIDLLCICYENLSSLKHENSQNMIEVMQYVRELENIKRTITVCNFSNIGLEFKEVMNDKLESAMNRYKNICSSANYNWFITNAAEKVEKIINNDYNVYFVVDYKENEDNLKRLLYTGAIEKHRYNMFYVAFTDIICSKSFERNHSEVKRSESKIN